MSVFAKVNLVVDDVAIIQTTLSIALGELTPITINAPAVLSATLEKLTSIRLCQIEKSVQMFATCRVLAVVLARNSSNTASCI
jgi:hypothetical protein